MYSAGVQQQQQIGIELWPCGPTISSDIFAAGPQSHSIRTISRAAWYELHLTWDKIKRIINLIQAEFGINRSDKFIVRYKCYNCDVLMKLNVFMET